MNPPTSVGFSLIETLIAMAVMVTFSGALIALVRSGESIARVQPDAADLQQRARVAWQTLGRELAVAGAGLERGPLPGPLGQFFPSIHPSPEGGVTVWYVSSRDAQASLAAPVAIGETQAALDGGVGCPPAQGACAFTASTTAILFDARGCHDVLRVGQVFTAALQFVRGPAACAYGSGAAIAEGEVRTYFADASTRQLMRRDEATGLTTPVLDGVDSMTAAYFEDASSDHAAPLNPPDDMRRVRRVRITLRLMASNARGAVPDLVVAFDATPANVRDR
jgi:Tfp pilus assembly protein PilV